MAMISSQSWQFTIGIAVGALIIGGITSAKIFEKTINFFVNYSFKEEFNLCIQGTEKELYEYPSLHLPQINLLIRTGGYHRLSDFCASLLNYAQIVFCSNLWPDFSIHQLNEIIKDLQPQNFGL